MAVASTLPQKQLGSAVASHPHRRRAVRRLHNPSSCRPRAAAAAPCRAQARPLLLDNYDSYTYNLYQIIAEAYGVDPLVLHNDEVDIATIQQLLAAGRIHHIILSPGPGTPHNPRDIGVCMDVLHHCPSTPVLGVCLGQQAMAVAAGGRVVRAPEPVHGRLNTLVHSGHDLFAGCPSGPGSGFDVVRYHSLVVDADSLPAELEPLAWTCGGHQAISLSSPSASSDLQLFLREAGAHADLAAAAAAAAAGGGGRGGSAGARAAQAAASGSTSTNSRLIMALRHRHRPHFGVQFHPESIATRYGVQLLLNFRDIACRHSGHSVDQQQQQQHGQHQQQHEQRQHQQINPVGPPGRALPARDWPAANRTQAAAVSSSSSSVSPNQQQQLQQGVDLAGLAPASCVGAAGLQLHWQRLPGAAAAVERGSAVLFSELVGPGPDTFWLDSSCAPERARFSFMGGPGLGTGPLWRRVTYKLPAPPSAASTTPSSSPSATGAGAAVRGGPSGGSAAAASSQVGLLSISQGSSELQQQDHQHQHHNSHHHQQQQQEQQQEQQQVVHASVFDYLQSQMQQLQLQPSCAAVAAAELPFNFWGGFVGYLGYELKAECGGANAHTAPGPDAAWLFADRLLVVDHELGDVWVLAVAPAAAEAAELPAGATAAAAGAVATCTAQQWVGNTALRVQHLAMMHGVHSSSSSSQAPAASRVQQQHMQHMPQVPSAAAAAGCVSSHGAQLRHGHDAYVANVASCKDSLMAGDSYELCLTTSYSLDGTQCNMQPPEPWSFYSTLRSINPAPYSAWLSVAASAAAPGITVCCSSPERFLSCGRGGVLEAKPIKGTARRHLHDPAADWASAAALLASEKERAENLMIVDLLRNDLGRVCEPGSVHVPGLIELESYTSVHQLVSTVRGLLRTDASCVEAVRAAFPGGSMTGAPKVRSMELLDELEGGPRGVYSGALGYLSVNDTFDLNIVIRTAVFVDQPGDNAEPQGTAHSSDSSDSSRGRVMTIGAGGAVTAQSDPEEEFAEMQLKAERLLMAASVAAEQKQQQQQQQQQACQGQETSQWSASDEHSTAAAAATVAAVSALRQLGEPVRR